MAARRGDPAIVGEETARLARNCHRLIWLNPLASAEGYRPLAAGMAAAYKERLDGAVGKKAEPVYTHTPPVSTSCFCWSYINCSAGRRGQAPF